MATRTYEFNIPGALSQNLSRPGAAALSWYRSGGCKLRLSYRELIQKVELAAGHLLSLGVSHGDRVMVISGNHPDVFITNLAITAIGAIVAPVNPGEGPRSLEFVVRLVNPSLIIVSTQTGEIKAPDGISGKCVGFSDLFQPRGGTGFELGSVRVNVDDPAVILFTSGTTSEPKGVCLSHGNLLANAKALHDLHRLQDNPVHMCVLPLFHANAFGLSLITSINSGLHVVLCDEFPGHAIWSIIRAEKVNILSLVPQIIHLLSLRKPEEPPGRHLRYVISAAAPLKNQTARRFLDATGVRIHQGYGLSECVNFATTIPADIDDGTYEKVMFGERFPSIGISLKENDVDVLTPEGRFATAGEEGQIVVSGDTLMQGYWNNPDATAETIVQGWLHTGDLGTYKIFNGQKFFFIHGRLKEIILRHGENISPAAIEADLEKSDLSYRFAVTGFENEFSGDEIGLYVQSDERPDPEDIRSLLCRECPEYRRPRVVLIGPSEIPVTSVGKIKRSALAQRFAQFSSRPLGTNPLVVFEEPAEAQPR